jgi:NAD(P)-dependent dehydrogenase (short-subunit alcohol dehydrogenase family)
MEQLEGKVAVITGGASGIGLGMARAFLRAGMKVAIADIRDDRLDKAKAALNGGGNVLAVTVDVQERASLERAADAVETAFGKIHVVCNNAGIGAGGPLHTVSEETWQRVLNVNLNSVFHGVQVFVPRIKRHGEGGHIVNTASMTGVVPIAGSGPYGVAKAAVAVLSEILRQDLAKEGISVSVLAPWIVNTPIFHTNLADDDAEAIEKHKARMATQWGGSLTEPDQVGEMVLQGIRTDELYIFNDPAARQMLERRIGKMYAALDREFPSG